MLLRALGVEPLMLVIGALRAHIMATRAKLRARGAQTAREHGGQTPGSCQPAGLTDIRRVAGTLRHNAGRIEQQSDDGRAALARLLTHAQSALSVAAEAPGDAA